MAVQTGTEAEFAFVLEWVTPGPSPVGSEFLRCLLLKVQFTDQRDGTLEAY